MAAPSPWFRMPTAPAPTPPTLRPAIPVRPPPPPPTSPPRPPPPNPQTNTPSPSNVPKKTLSPTVSSPKTANFPSHNHPSPLQLPPPLSREEPKIEQKSVLLQDEKSMRTNNHASKGTKAKKLSDSEDAGMRVITIAGDNKGAFMEIKSPAKGYTLSNTNQLQRGEEGKSHDKDKETTFLNSNVQGVNNSIVYNSSCHHNDPGIHLSLVKKANNDNSAGRG